jgi:hypothetical protein
MNPELIRYARRHRYEIAEGFCDEEPDRPVGNAIEAGFEKLSLKHQELFNKQAAELAKVAGIPFIEAWSALLNWILKKHLEIREAQRNN